MKKLALLVACLLPNVSCADSADVSGTKTIRSSDNYVLAGNINIVQGLDQRLSLISNSADRSAYVLNGDDEPVVLALSAPHHFFKEEGNNYSYIKPENALLLGFGPQQGGGCNASAELQLYKTGEAVGRVSYSCNGYPNNPYSITDLCTGTYEKTCAISFDQTKKLFAIELLPPEQTND